MTNDNKKNKLTIHLLTTFGITTIAIIIGFFLSMTPTFYNVNNWTFDGLFRKYAKPNGKTDECAIIEIDDWSLSQAE